jgi:hypothetical protein
VLRDTDKLKQELDRTRKDLEQSLVERDFLERFNKNLKTQCEQLTKELLILKANTQASDSKRPEKSIYLSRDEGDNSSKGRNSCNDLQLPIRRK